MTAELSPEANPDPNPETAEANLAILDQVVYSYGQGKGDRPSPDRVVAALLQAEQTTRRQHLSLPFPEGQWRLCFTTGVKKRSQGGIALGKGFYLPRLIPAGITFEADVPGALTGVVQNQIQLGGLFLQLSGVCRYQPPKNLMVFDFTALHLCLFGLTLYQGAIRGGSARAEAFAKMAIAQLPFFAFFCVGDRYIAARGKGGGLAIWVKP